MANSRARLLSHALIALASVALIGSCTESEGGAASSTAAATPTKQPVTTSENTAALGPPLSAEDGRNFGACADGLCEVLVRPGDTVEWLGNRVSIISIHGAEVGVDARFSYGGSIKTTTDREVWTTPDGVNVTIVAVKGDEAVLRIGRKSG